MRYVILPYAVTSRPLTIRGFTFRRSDDLEGHNVEAVDNLQSLFKLFYLQADLRLKQMSYSVIPQVEQSKWSAVAQKLLECSICMRYICTKPNPRMPRYVNATLAGMYPAVEIVDMFVFQPRSITNEHFLPQHATENLEYAGSESQESLNMDGFHGWMIGRANSFDIGKSSRIYPPHFAFDNHPLFRFRVDIAAIFDELTHGSKWALKQFITSQSNELSSLEKRILKAMDWYNQSCEYGMNPLRSLVFLAIAFEALLNLKWEADNTARFKDVVKVLIGPVERLDSWLDQFFKARGDIVHMGETEYLEFYPPAGPKKYHRDMPISVLTDPGQAIFHLCLDAILCSSVTAREAKLHADFRHSEERIQEIFSIIEKRDTRSPFQRLASVRDAVIELTSFVWQRAGRVKPTSVLHLTSKMIELFLSDPSYESLGIRDDIVSKMRDFVRDMKQFDASKADEREIEKHCNIIEEVENWYSERLQFGFVPSNEPFDVLMAFLHYAYHHFSGEGYMMSRRPHRQDADEE
jgi:hypothetical protein